MFWDSINSDLFKPLASANSKVYSIALFSLYEHLIVNQTEIGECTPVNAKQVKKVIYLAITQASKKWTMPIRNWKSALNRFIIEFEDRISDYI